MRNKFLLDADETILDFVRSSRESLAHAMRALGLPYGDDFFSLYKAINDGVWKEYEQGKITKKQLIQVRFVRFLERIGVQADAQKLNAVYFETLSHTGYLLDGAAEFLRGLKERGKIFLITNGTPAAQYGRLESLGLRGFFDGIFVSDEIGYVKPDSRFFDYVLEKVCADKSECIVIGDSLSSDIAGAANAGILSVWYNPAGKPAGAVKPDYTAKSYAEILALLDALAAGGKAGAV